MANLSRIKEWWRTIDWRAFAAYGIPGGPAAFLGAQTLLILPSSAVALNIGVFLISMIPIRHWLAKRMIRLKLWHLAIAGAVSGFLTGSGVATGPISVPVFLGYGRVKVAVLA